VATAATMVRIALPKMIDRGYARSLAAGGSVANQG
jgi:TRAP-type C4-dicarboxylate transport system permease large subunit